MTDSRVPRPRPSVPSAPGPGAAAEAAAERTRSAARRLVEIQERMVRLRAGEPSTPEDVRRARAAAMRQRARASTQRRELATTALATRSAWERAAVVAGSEAPAATRSTAVEPTHRSRSAELGPDRTSGEDIRSGSVQRQGRLHDAFVALVTERIDDSPLWTGYERRRDLVTALVDAVLTGGTDWTSALCRLAIAEIPGVCACATSAYDEDGIAHPFAAADDPSAQLEELQQVVGEGPGPQARYTGRPVLVDDLSAETAHWPGYVAAVEGRGIGAMWSLPVGLHHDDVASITFYHRAGRLPGAAAWPDAVILAALAAVTMTIDVALAGDLLTSTDADDAADAVDVASGVLAARANIAVGQALALLRSHAFSTGRRITDVAADVVHGRLDLS